jgi:hypothetical protein
MITIENRVGRFIEVRFMPPLTDGDIASFQRDRERLMKQVGKERIVCLDLSRLQVLPPERAEIFIEMLRRSHPGMLRNALLLPPGQATLALQFGRILREANNPARRVFQSQRELIAWLGELMQPGERARLLEFLRDALPVPP